jgi:hypothetical protein
MYEVYRRRDSLREYCGTGIMYACMYVCMYAYV